MSPRKTTLIGYVMLAFLAWPWGQPIRAFQTSPSTGAKPRSSSFVLTRDAQTGFIASLRRAGDADGVEYIRPGSTLGPIRLRVRSKPEDAWRDVDSRQDDLELYSLLQPRDDCLRWDITAINRTAAALGPRRLHLALDRDGFAREQPITLSRSLNRFAFEIESRALHEHETRLTVEGLPPGAYNVNVGGKAGRAWLKDRKPAAIAITVPGNRTVSVRVEPLSPSAVSVNCTVNHGSLLDHQPMKGLNDFNRAKPFADDKAGVRQFHE